MRERENLVKLAQLEEDELTADINAALSIKENASPEADLAPEGDEQSLRVLAEILGFPYVSMREAQIDDAILSLIPAEFARKNDVMPHLS